MVSPSSCFQRATILDRALPYQKIQAEESCSQGWTCGILDQPVDVAVGVLGLNIGVILWASGLYMYNELILLNSWPARGISSLSRLVAGYPDRGTMILVAG